MNNRQSVNPGLSAGPVFVPPARPSFVAWAAVPSLLVLLLMALSPFLFDPAGWERWIHDENGILEKTTILVLLPATVLALLTARRRRLTHLTVSRDPTDLEPPRPGRAVLVLKVWFILFAIGCFYFAGEEASWGQHALGFTPPAAIAERNLQGEFNLHNTKGWAHDLLNEIPRTLATGFCLVICGILPLIHRPNPRHQSFWARFWRGFLPTRALVFPGLIAALIAYVETPLDEGPLDRAGTWLYYALLEANDELKETLIALALSLYSLDRYRAARRLETPTAEAA
jgi:hypothetical protein